MKLWEHHSEYRSYLEVQAQYVPKSYSKAASIKDGNVDLRGIRVDHLCESRPTCAGLTRLLVLVRDLGSDNPKGSSP